MYQDLVAVHVSKIAPVDAQALVQTANKSFFVSMAPQPYEARATFNLTGTAVAQWAGAGVLVVDPEQRGKMVLSWEAAFYGEGGCTGIMPLVIDRQGVASSVAGTQIPLIGSGADVEFAVPQASDASGTARWSSRSSGRMLVDTSITSATPGITTREFGVSLSALLTAGASDIVGYVHARLYNESEQFFQPLK